LYSFVVDYCHDQEITKENFRGWNNATARAQQKGAGPFAILTGKELYDMTQVQASIMCSDWKEAKKRFLEYQHGREA